MKNNKLLPISITIVGLSVFVGSFWLGNSIKESANIQAQRMSVQGNGMDISQAANYIGVTEDELQGIIKAEQNTLEAEGTYVGMMIPYFIVNDNMYFNKNQIDEWLVDVSTQYKEYDTQKGHIK